MQTIKNKIFTLLTLLTLLVLGSADAWAYTWTASVGVDQGKGSAYIEIYNNAAKIFGGQKVVATSKSTTSTALESCNTSVTAATTNGWPICHATAGDGYHFTGWYSVEEKKVVNATDVNYNTYLYLSRNWSRTYYARFAANAYKVKFNANGGTGTMTDQSFTYDAAQNLTANAFTKTGYTFAGWATSADGDVAYSDGQSVSNLTTTNNGTVTLYAKWTANTYYVAFNGNGSTSGSMSNQTFTYATAKSLTTNAYSKDDVVTFNPNGGSCGTTSVSKNATFLGWATSADGAKVYDDKQSVSNLTSTAGATVNLFAKWSQTNTITLPDATKAGAVLAGWSDGVTNVGEAGATYSVPLGGITLTAIWIDKYSPVITGANHSMKVSDLQNTAFTFEHTDNPEPHITVTSLDPINNGDGQVIEYNAESNTIIAHNAGTATIYFTQAETSTIKSGTSATYTYTVTKVDNTLAVSGASFTKYVDEEITNVVNNKNNTTTALTTESTAEDVAHYDIEHNKIVISNSSAESFTSKDVTITIAQAENYKYTATNKTITVTVKKYATSIASATNYNDVKVDVTPFAIASYNLQYVSQAQPDSSAAGHDFYYTIEHTFPVNKNVKGSAHPNEVIAYNPANHTISAYNAGSAVLTIAQKETYKYTGDTVSFNVTVSKYTPSFTWNGGNTTPYYHNTIINNIFSSTGNSPYTIAQSTDTLIAREDNNTLSILTKSGTAQFTVTQEEDYYWNGKSETYSVTPLNQSNHLTLNYTQAMFNDGSITSKAGTTSWYDNYAIVGDWALGGFDWDDKYVVIHFTGIPDKLTFQYRASTKDVSNGFTGPYRQADWYVAESSNGTSWTTKWTNVTNTEEFIGSGEIQLSESTRYVKLCYSGNFAGYFSNIRITELKQFEPTLSSLNFGENQRNVVCPSQTLGLNYANAGHSVTLTTDDDHFSVTPAKITTIGGEQLGTYTPITVSYRTDELHSASDAKLIIRDELGHETFVTLIGSTLKKVQNITWNSPYNVDEPIIPVGKNVVGAATAGSGLTVTYTTSDSSVIEIVNGTSFRAVGVGSATITAQQSGDPEWEAAEDSPKTFHVTAKKVQMIVWGQDLTGLLTTDDPFALTARVMLMDTITGEFAYNADRTNLLDYNVENTAVATVSGSTLTIQGEGSTTITASVPGDEEYEAASVTMPIEVSSPSATCEDRNLTLFAPVSGGEYGYQEGSDYILYKFDLGEPELYVTYEIDHTSGVPGVVSFKLKGTKWGANYRGNIEVRISDDGSTWSDVLLSEQPTVGRYTSHTIALQRTTRFIRFIRPRWGEGYHHIGSVKVLPAQYLEAEDVDFGPMEVGSSLTREIDVYYSNVKGDIAITSSAPAIVMVDHSVLSADCGAFGSQKLKITCSPSVVADIDETITISEPLSGLTRTIHVTAEVTKGSQTITWNPERTTFEVVESAELTAVLPTKTNKGQTVTLESSDPTVVDIIAGQAVIYKPGNVTITASQAGNANFAPAENVEKDFVITLATLSLTAPSASSINDEQPLSASILTGGTATDVHGSVDGTWSWESPETVYAVGTYYPRVIFTPNEHPEWYTGNTTTTTIVVTPSSYRYVGNGQWNEKGNWNKKDVPTINDDVVINGNVTIPGEANAKSLTINEGSNVTLSVSGQLTIGSGNSKVLDNYGNLHVENGGKVILNEGDLKVKDLVIEAKLGNMNTPANSAEINQADLLNVTGDVYFKLTFDPRGYISAGWYDFVVPFEVDVVGGIFLPDNTSKPLTNNVDFAIMEFSEERRAANEKSWTWVSGTLQPGKLYTITLDDEKPERNTYMFKKRRDAAIEASSTFSAQCTSNAASTDKGWNGMGNGTLQYRQLNLPVDAKIQVYDHENRCYVQCDAKDYQYAVGTAFFVQVESTKLIDLTTISNNRLFRAPRAEEASTDEFCLALTLEGAENASDHIWVSASDEATGEYVIGRDLVKMGEPNEAKVARIWAKRNNLQLCDAEMPLVYGEANCDLNVFAPADGTYLLEIENGPADAELYLTFNGKVIWDLTSSPASLVLKKGLKEGFGLRMKYNDAPGMAEGVDDINDDTQSMRKVLIDNKIYIITPEGAMYDVNGKLIR